MVSKSSRASPMLIWTRGLLRTWWLTGARHLGHVQDGRLELGDVDALHLRQRAEPPRRAPRAETDDHGALDRGVQHGADQAAHDLGRRVDDGVAVALAVDDEGPAVPAVERDRALHAVGFPLHARAARCAASRESC